MPVQVCIFNPTTTLIDQITAASIGPAAAGVPVVTNSQGLIDSSLVGNGVLATAGQNVAYGQLINLYSNGGVLTAQIASAASTGTAPSGASYPVQAQGFAGLSTAGATTTYTGAMLTVNFFGTFTYLDGNSEFSASNIGAEVFLSAVTPGGITLTPPAALEQSVGYVVGFASPNVVTVSFLSGFQDFSHISGVNPVTKGGTGATTGAVALINLIGGSPTTGQALVWNGTAWTPSFAAETSFTDILTGVNTTATMTVGTGATLTFSGSGVVNANQVYGVAVSSTAPTAGQVLTATSATAAAWATAVNPGTANQIAYYAATGAAVSGDALLTDSGTVLAYTGTGGISAPLLSASTSLAIAGGTPLTTTNQTGTGDLVLATSPTVSGATLSGSVSVTGSLSYTTANPAFFSAQGNGSKVQLSTGSTTSGDLAAFDANGNTIDSGVGSATTGTGDLVLATSPTVSGATLSGTITISGTASYTTANPTFFSSTGTGAVVLATSPAVSGATLSGAITISGTATYTTANPTFFSSTGTGAVVLATSPTLVTPNIGAATASSLTVTSTVTSYNGQATAGNGLASVAAATSQKSESAADASVLSFTPPATAGSYRVRFVLSVSAANAATLGWTVTWTDSNGNAQTPANLALFQSGVAAPSLTYTTSAAGNYNGSIDLDVNNSATPIVVQLTFTGTSFAALASATIERIV